ncbi:MAG: sugar nucleotide-binding protein [Acidobacteriota bacterium]
MRASPVIFLTGASGYLGRYVIRELQARGVPFTAVGRSRPTQENHLRVPFLPLDLSEPEAVAAMAEVLRARLDRHAVVLHAGALSSLAECEKDPDHTRRVNVESSALFADAVPTLLVSTDLVFGGSGAPPYSIEDATAPMSLYGESKVEAEQSVLSQRGAVARIPLLFGPSADGRRGATDHLRNAEEAHLFSNEFRTPLHVEDAARGLVELCLDFEGGSKHHLTYGERVSRLGLGERFLEASDCSTELLGVECQDADRPRDVSLVPTWSPGRSLDESLQSC